MKLEFKGLGYFDKLLADIEWKNDSPAIFRANIEKVAKEDLILLH